MRVQVVYASRHGGTAGIAERIEDVLKAAGLDVELADAATRPDAAGFDAFVVGSAVYLGRWLDEGVRFLERHRELLAARPVWLFSSGPVGLVPRDQDPVEAALGPAEGPGSAGHKRIDALAATIQPRDHHVFSGAFDPSDPPKSLQETVMRMLPSIKATLPAADFRDWVEIEKWAHGIVAELSAVGVA